MMKTDYANMVEKLMRMSVVLGVISLLASGNIYAGCFELVEVGDPGFTVIEKCGEPQRREREELKRTKSVEVLRGQESTRQIPHQPIVRERWYYDTSLNAATVIHLEDNGVTEKGRLLREE
jgi:hypothetical protein